MDWVLSSFKPWIGKTSISGIHLTKIIPKGYYVASIWKWNSQVCIILMRMTLFSLYFSFSWSSCCILFAETHWYHCSIRWSLVQFFFWELVCIYTLLSCKLSLVLHLSSFSMFPKSTHGTFSTKLFQHFLSHHRLEKEKFSETDFTLSHYAGKVIQCCCSSSCLAKYIL